jgi:hypothetical protein
MPCSDSPSLVYTYLLVVLKALYESGNYLPEYEQNRAPLGALLLVTDVFCYGC